MVNVQSIRLDTQRAIAVNRVLRNTYLLLSLTIAFCALVTTAGIVLGIGMMNIFVYIAGFFGFSWAVNRTANSSWGLFWTFVFVGFIGLAMAPMLAYYLSVHPFLIVQALALTAATFVALSLYTVVRRQDFSWLGQFLTVAFVVVLGLIVVSFFVDLSAFAIVISGFMVFVAVALMLYQTSQIVLGGETNYIIATNNLFVSVYLLFMYLLSILGIMNNE